MSVDFWCKKHGARTTQDGKCDVCNIKHRDAWSSDCELPSIEECQSVLKDCDNQNVKISMDNRTLEIIGIDFAKRSDNVKYGMLHQPKTISEETVYWFLHGKKYQSAPQHFNCKCQAIPFKHISTEG